MKKGVIYSVITVVFNCADTIERTIQSVLTQERNGIEYIIIDGGSMDGTVDIIKKYEKEISYWVSEPDKGIYDAMNKGIGHANGTWISFINANDWYESNAFEIFGRAIADNPDASIIYGLVNRVWNGQKNGYIGTEKKIDVEELHFGNKYCHQGLLIKRQLFEKYGMYDTNYKLLADYEWLLRVHEKGVHPMVLTDVVANYTAGGVSESETGLLESCKISLLYYKNHPKFSPELEKKRGYAAFNLLYLEKAPVLNQICHLDMSCYIWGTGDYGRRIYHILEKNQSDIVGFLQTNPRQDSLEGIKIYDPNIVLEQISNSKQQLTIYVATEKYEEEILNDIRKYPAANLKIITMSMLFEKAQKEYHKMQQE